MLKYIEGKIELKNLDRNARSYERRQAHTVWMKELQRENQRMHLRIEGLGHAAASAAEENEACIEKLEQTIAGQSSSLDMVTKNVNASKCFYRLAMRLPKWIRPKCLQGILHVMEVFMIYI